MSNVHAFMSPSAFKTARACPASPSRQAHIERRKELLQMVGVEFYGLSSKEDKDRWSAITKEDNTAAEDGTKAHNVFETAILQQITDKEVIREMVEKEDMQGPLKGDEFILDQLHRCVLEQLEMLDEASWIGVEERIRVIGLPQFGTIDLTWRTDRTLYLRDLKTGMLEVESEDNDQLMNYGVGVLDKLDAWDEVDEVHIKILGLRFKVEEWICSIEDLRTYKHDVMLPAFMAAYAINPEAIPGNHCLYCSAKISCKEWQDEFNGLSNEHFNTDISEMDVQDQVELYAKCKQAEKLAKDLSKEILIAFEGFDEPKGITQVNGRKRTEYALSEEEMVEKLTTEHDVEKSLLYETKLLSPAQLKAKLGEDAPDEIFNYGRNAPYLKLKS